MTTKVRMRTTYAGPAGTARAGDTIDVEDDQAQTLIEIGYAEEVAPAPIMEAGTAGTSEAGEAEGDDAAEGAADRTETAEGEHAPETTATRTRRPTPRGKRRVGPRRPAAGGEEE